MDMQPVKSSNIHSIGYDEPSKTMRVKYHTGDTYQFHNVPPDAHEAFANASSPGAHFAMYMRGRYPSKNLGHGQ